MASHRNVLFLFVSEGVTFSVSEMKWMNKWVSQTICHSQWLFHIVILMCCLLVSFKGYCLCLQLCDSLKTIVLFNMWLKWKIKFRLGFFPVHVMDFLGGGGNHIKTSRKKEVFKFIYFLRKAVMWTQWVGIEWPTNETEQIHSYPTPPVDIIAYFDVYILGYV